MNVKNLGGRVKRNMVRLTEPLIRRGDRFEPASWDEALAHSARLFEAIREESGGEALGVFSCSKATNELNYLASKFARSVFRTNNIDSCNRT